MMSQLTQNIEIRSQLQGVVMQWKHSLLSSSDVHEIKTIIELANLLLPSTLLASIADDQRRLLEDAFSSRKGDDDWRSFQNEFVRSHYLSLGECIIGQLSLDWFGKVTGGVDGRDKVESFFVNAPPQDAVMLLSTSVFKSEPSFKRDKCLSFLEKLLKSHKLAELFWDQCKGQERISSMRIKATWDQLINLLANLPDKIANTLTTDNWDIFLPDQYFEIVARDVLQTLHRVHQHLSDSKDCSLVFISHLLGKICLCGYSAIIFDFLLPHLLKLSSDDYIWSRISVRLFAGGPERSLEIVLDCLLRRVPWFGHMSKLLGDAVLNNQKVKYLLTNKFLLLRYTENDLVLKNIIGYLADSPSRAALIPTVLSTLLDAWSDSSALKHTSYEQHLYITKAIMICTSRLTQKDVDEHKDAFLHTLMRGMQAHLNTPIARLRTLGMVVAESLTKKLTPDVPPLTFEYEHDDTSTSLKNLLVIPEDPGLDGIVSNLKELDLKADKEEAVVDDNDGGHPRKIPDDSRQNEDLDSDDDLEPCDMSGDTKVTKVKEPHYIRDCMEGLIVKDNPDLVEASLKVAEKLIRRKPDNLSEIAVEWCKVLLHLEDSYHTVGFTELRMGSLRALTVCCPVTVASYLTEQFYDRNYNIRQRIDMLEVLSGAAQELSKPDSSQAGGTSQCTNDQLIPINQTPGTENWRDIVQKRIDSKTRRFASATKKGPVSSANQFAAVAGHFFFPLMKTYDSPMNTMNLLGGDFYLLGRLVHTLAMVLHSAQNTMICKQMSKSLLGFIWVIRYHVEPYTPWRDTFNGSLLYNCIGDLLKKLPAQVHVLSQQQHPMAANVMAPSITSQVTIWIHWGNRESYVRQAVMFAVAMVIISVPTYTITTDLQSDLIECQMWLEDIVDKDPEPECKKQAAETILMLQQAITKELKDEG